MKKTISVCIAVLIIGSAGLWAEPARQDAASLYEQGVSEQNRDNWYAASQHFLEAIRLNPVYADARFHLAQCSFQLGEIELALSQLDEAEKYERGSIRIQNLRGSAFISLGRYADARAVFENVLQIAPNDVEARFGLAELDLFDGRVSGAESRYLDALKRQSENRKALLSIAFVSAGLGKNAAALKYIRQALRSYSGIAEVHYFAALIYTMQNTLAEAEKQCRIAVEIDGNYDKAYELLAKIRYAQGEYADVIAICDFRLNRNKKLASALYLKGAAEMAGGDTPSAIESWTEGLQLDPEDEVMRAALELAVGRTVALEDERRSGWAQYHLVSAKEYMRRYDGQGALYEYQRALKIQPSNKEARLAFAKRLSMNGMHELYLEQLLFLKENDAERKTMDGESAKKTRAQVTMDDTIEAYKDLLKDTLAKKWNVEPFTLDKTRWKLGICYQPSPVGRIHAESNKIAAEFAADLFSNIAITSVQTYAEPVSGFGEAYQKARSGGLDYFIMISIDEGARDFVLDYAMHSARTGNKIAESSLYSTGNRRYVNAFRRFRADILEKLPIRAKIIGRDGKNLLIDIGKSENTVNGSVFEIVRKNAVQTAGDGGGITYREADALGTLTVTAVGEEISEGRLEYKGFYDRVNLGDEVILLSVPKQPEESAKVSDTAPAADAEGKPVENLKLGLTAQELGIKRLPSFIDIIRSIY